MDVISRKLLVLRPFTSFINSITVIVLSEETLEAAMAKSLLQVYKMWTDLFNFHVIECRLKTSEPVQSTDEKICTGKAQSGPVCCYLQFVALCFQVTQFHLRRAEERQQVTRRQMPQLRKEPSLCWWWAEARATSTLGWVSLPHVDIVITKADLETNSVCVCVFRWWGQRGAGGRGRPHESAALPG